MDEVAYDVFVSYSTSDGNFAERVARAIEADRSGPPLRVFYAPWTIRPGADVAAELEAGLQTSRFLALVLSPEALESPWVKQERFTAIWRDPSAGRASLIPLLRRDSEVPHALARLKHIDFRQDSEFSAGMAELIAAVRGRSVRSDGEMAEDDFNLREDAALLQRHRIFFDRPAFQMSCADELFLHELSNAVDDTVAALNTGSLFSRDGRVLRDFSPKSEYRLESFRAAFKRIVTLLGRLKRQIVDFEEFYRSVNPDYSHHRNFYAMLNGLFYRSSPPTGVTRDVVARLDAIDAVRNEILSEVNALLRSINEREFDLIEPSSSRIRQQSYAFEEPIVDAL